MPRTHLNAGIPLRNMNKLAAYTNASGQTINLTLTSTPVLNVPNYLGGAVINAAILNNNNY